MRRETWRGGHPGAAALRYCQLRKRRVLRPGSEEVALIMRVFVTGGAGFIGSHYVRELLSDSYPAFAGARVTVFDKLTYCRESGQPRGGGRQSSIPIRAWRHLLGVRP